MIRSKPSSLLAGLLLAWTTFAHADLIAVGADINVQTGLEFSKIAVDANPVSGEYVVCFIEFIFGPRVECKRFDASDNLIGDPLFFETFGDFTPIDVDVELGDTGDVIAMLRGRAQFDTKDSLRVQGWDASGAQLFNEVAVVDQGSWVDADLALTASSFWVGGATQRTNGNLIEIVAHRYTLAGARGTTVSPAQFPPDRICTNLTDFAANRSGDLVLSYVQPTNNVGCAGTIYALTFRDSGVGDDIIQMSDMVMDNGGNDVTDYVNPVAIAYDDQVYVVSWSDDISTYGANLTLSGRAATDQQVLQTGIEPRLAADPISRDYILLARFEFSGCELLGRIAIEADLEPFIAYELDTCGDENELAFLPDGTAILVRTEFNLGQFPQARVYLNRIGMPAQLEVGSVTVQEGSPASGGGIATLSVSMLGPQPGGEQVQVDYFTRSVSALGGIDYALSQGTLTFPGNGSMLTQTLSIPIVGDSIYEDDEVFEVGIERPINAVISKDRDTASVTILDDDPSPPILTNCDDDSIDPRPGCRTVIEPDPGESEEVTIILTMAEPVDADISISYATEDGTATAAGLDYQPASGTVSIVAGATTASITLVVLGNAGLEGEESFDLVLSAASAVNLTETRLQIVIEDEPSCFAIPLQTGTNDLLEALVFTEGGGSGNFVVEAPNGCAWNATTQPDWISIMEPADGIGSGFVEFDVATFDPPPGEVSRTAFIDVHSTTGTPMVRRIEIRQDGACDFNATGSPQTFTATGGTGTFDVTVTDQRCAWGVTSNDDWLSITSPLGAVIGDGSAEFTVAPNVGAENEATPERTAMLASNEFDYTVTQSGCTFALGEASLSTDAAGDVSFQIDVISPELCPWTAVSQSSWILIRDGGSGTGAGTVEIFILDNPTTTERIGSVLIGGQILSVSQSGLGCAYATEPMSITACPDGGSFEFDVNATDGCTWEIAEDAAWALLTDDSPGVGPATRTGLIDANLSEVARTATLTLSGDGTNYETDITQEGYLVYETFEADLPADWSYFETVISDQDPSGFSVADGALVANGLNRTRAVAIEQSVAGLCQDCEIEARVVLTSVSSTPGSAVEIIGFFRDDLNYASVGMDEFSNVWSLSQTIAGTTRSVSIAVDEIVPNREYEVDLIYDGTSFFADIDGEQLLVLDANGEPFGNAGVAFNGSNGRLSEIRVRNVQIAANQDPDAIFDHAFEPHDLPNLSACIQEIR